MIEQKDAPSRPAALSTELVEGESMVERTEAQGPHHPDTRRPHRLLRSVAKENVLLQIFGVLGFLALWDLSVRTGLVSRHDVPLPVSVLVELSRQLQSSEFWSAILRTLAGAGVGLLIATVAAVAAGIALGSSRVVWHAFRPTVEFLRPVPGVALIPLAILLWGQGIESDIALVTFSCFWVIVVQTMQGVQQIDEVAQQTAKVFGLSRLSRLRSVTIPSLIPFVVTGERVAAPLAIATAITVELVIGSPGLGSSIGLAQNAGRIDVTYALVFAAGLLGMIFHILAARLEAHFMSWHESQRTEGSP